jgi:hypothetical protein
LPEKLTLAPWPGAVRTLEESDVIDALLTRCRADGGEALCDQVRETIKELKQIEREQMQDLIRGVGMQTLWQRKKSD